MFFQRNPQARVVTVNGRIGRDHIRGASFKVYGELTQHGMSIVNIGRLWEEKNAAYFVLVTLQFPTIDLDGFHAFVEGIVSQFLCSHFKASILDCSGHNCFSRDATSYS